MSQKIKCGLHNNNALPYCTHYIYRPLFRLLTTVTSRHPNVVQFNFKSVSQSESRIALNDFAKHAPDHIRSKLVTALETNAYQLMLDVPSVSNSQPHQNPSKHIIN